MKHKLFGLSCVSFMLLCTVGGFLALFVGSVLFSQMQARFPVASATPVPASQTSAPEPTDSQFGMTVIAPATAIPVTVAPMQSATPGLAPLGTISYPLTVTAEFAMDATRVRGFQNGIAATRTANAQQAQVAHATLTAAAVTPSGK